MFMTALRAALGASCAFLFAFALIVPALAAHSTDEREIIIERFAELRASVGALYAQKPDGDMQFLCSATAVGHHKGQTIILSAWHCLQRGVSYLINFGDNNLRPLKVWKIPHYELNEAKYPRQFNEPATDMALFLMDGTDVPIVKMADKMPDILGGKIQMVGYPLGVSKITYEGIMAGQFDRLGGDYYGYGLLQIFGAPGSSGSSVIDTKTGEVIAVLVAAKQTYVGLPVIFATPIEYRKYLKEVRPDADVGAEPEPEQSAP